MPELRGGSTELAPLTQAKRNRKKEPAATKHTFSVAS